MPDVMKLGGLPLFSLIGTSQKNASTYQAGSENNSGKPITQKIKMYPLMRFSVNVFPCSVEKE